MRFRHNGKVRRSEFANIIMGNVGTEISGEELKLKKDLVVEQLAMTVNIGGGRAHARH